MSGLPGRRRPRGDPNRGLWLTLWLLFVGGIGTIVSQLEVPPAVKIGGTLVALLGSVVLEVVRERRAARAPGEGAAARDAGPARLSNDFPMPSSVADFTDREPHLDRIDAEIDRRSSEWTAILVIGQAGVGKTALAVQAARRLADRFPDGHVYLNLRGVEQQRLAPTDVLARLLRWLGVDSSAIPTDVDEMSQLFRGRVAGRRILFVFDNTAADESSIRPLLAGAAGCAAILTSRYTLAGIEATARLPLEVLTDAYALELLARVVGGDRIAGDSEAAGRIVALTGSLPLALRIAGAKLNAKPHWTARNLVDRLQSRLLDELAVGDVMVRASFQMSYEDRTSEQRRAFRLLGLVQTPTFGAWVAAALLDLDVETAEDLVERLVDAQLLEGVGDDAVGCGRYRFHDLLRVYSRECLQAEEPPTDQAAATQRMIGAYLTLVERADAALKPDRTRTVRAGRAPRYAIDSPELIDAIDREPIAWLTTEAAGLVTIVTQAHEAGEDELAWELAGSVADFYDIRGSWPEWGRVNELGLISARRAGSRFGEAIILHFVGLLARYRRRLDDAMTAFEGCLPIFADVGDIHEAHTVREIGIVHLEQCDNQDAQSCFQRCLELFRQLGERRWEAYSLQLIGRIRARTDEPAAAIELYQQSMAIYREIEDFSGEAASLRYIGDAYRVQDQLETAIEHYRQGLRLQERVQGRLMEAWTLEGLAAAYAAAGDIDAARDAWGKALTVFDGLGLSDAARVRAALAALLPASAGPFGDVAQVAAIENGSGHVVTP